MNESTPRLDPFYYLRYFEQAMQWLSQCYDDLWNEEERGFLATFSLLPQPLRPLLVRLIMRRGNYSGAVAWIIRKLVTCSSHLSH